MMHSIMPSCKGFSCSSIRIFPRGKTPGGVNGYSVVVECWCLPIMLFPRGRASGEANGHPEEVMYIQWKRYNAHLLFFFLERGHQMEVMDIQWGWILMPSVMIFPRGRTPVWGDGYPLLEF
jgi:hypothetical protein